MLHKIIGSGHIITPFLRFTTDSGVALDPVFSTGGSATFEWISPDGIISTGTTPNPALDQVGVYVVKCSDWSDVIYLDFRTDNVTVLDNLSLLTSLTILHCLDNNLDSLNLSGLNSLVTMTCHENNIIILDIIALTSLAYLNCRNNNISILEVAALTSLVTFYCQDNGMDETNIDKILADLVTAGANNGSLNMGGTNAAPSAAGDANVLILEGRGWTVITS